MDNETFFRYCKGLAITLSSNLDGLTPEQRSRVFDLVTDATYCYLCGCYLYDMLGPHGTSWKICEGCE